MPRRAKPKSIAAKIGAYARYQREKRGWSLNEMAERIAVTPSFLLRLEQGVYQTIKLDVLQKIAHGFQMSLVDFLAKSEIESEYRAELPPIEFYFKEKYQFPPAAIDDVLVFIEVLKHKYRQEIADLVRQHQAYWGRKSHSPSENEA